jgi:hypothetical protein
MRLRNCRRLWWLPVLGASSACVPTFDQDQTQISEPRILAVQAVPAEVKPGATVSLEALIAAPDGIAITAPSWSLCEARKRLTELGPVEQSCLQGEDLSAVGEGRAVSATISVDVCRMFGPVRPDPVDNLPAGRAVEPDPTGGFFQPVLVAFEKEQTLASVRLSCGLVGIPTEASIALTRGARPNQNPRITSLQAGAGAEERDTDLVVHTSASVEFTVHLPHCPSKPTCGDGICSFEEDKVDCAEDCAEPVAGCAGAERYVYYNPSSRTVEVQQEELTVSWFASVGSWSSTRTEVVDGNAQSQVSDNSWRAPPTAGKGALWVVVRDNRGGVGWSRQSLVVR